MLTGRSGGSAVRLTANSAALVFSPKMPYAHKQSIGTLQNLWEYMK
jgi:hypothetical protein